MKSLGLRLVLLLLFFSIGTQVSAQNDRLRTERFKIIDADGNEVITIREMRTYYRGKKSKFDKLIDSKKIFFALDANENSIITLNEYLGGEDWVLSYKYFDKWQFKDDYETLDQELNKENIGQVKFLEIDKNQNNTLDFEEVDTFYKGKFNLRTEELVNSKIEFVSRDIDNNGIITLDEFNQQPNWKLGYDRLKTSEQQANIDSTKELSDIYIKQRIEIFGVVDANDDYKVTLVELEDYYKGKLNDQGNPVNALFQFYGLDKNEDDSIELAEFASKIDLDLARRKYESSNKK